MPINWNLAQAPQQANIMQPFEQGLKVGEEMRKRAQEREVRGALETLARNPQDEAARQVVFRHNPELGMKLGTYAGEQAFRSAVGDWVASQGQPNALLGMGTQQGGAAAPQPSRNALAASVVGPADPQGQSFQNAFAPLVGGSPPMPGIVSGFGGGTFDQQGREVTPVGGGMGPSGPLDQQQVQQQVQQPDFSALGTPQSREDAAFLRMLRADPLQALKIQSAMRDNFVDRLKAESDFYSLAVDALSRVTDDSGWQASLQRLGPMAQALGSDLSTVPATYPGTDAVQQLLQQALPVKERLDHLLRASDVEADNTRQDRNAASLIEDRTARRGEQVRYNNERIATTRRGQDLGASRGRNGSAAGADRRGAARPTATDAKGNKMEWNGSAWVPVR